jgi:hypothetical protein
MAASEEEALPHPRAAVTVYQAASPLAAELGRPQPKTLPDSAMKPEASGSDFQA